MHVTLTGPIDTNILRRVTNSYLDGAPSGQGGGPVPELASGILRQGHEVSIVTLSPSIDAPVVVRADRLSVTFVPLRGPPRYKARERVFDLFSKEISYLVGAIKSYDQDIVHAHWTYEYAEAALRAGRPHLVTMHDLGWECLWYFRDAYRFMRLVMKYRSVPRVKYLAVVSPFMRSRAWQYGYFGKAVTLPNSIDVPYLDNAMPERKFCSAPKFAAVGSNGRLKNIAAVTDAFPQILEKHPDAELHLFGPGLDASYCAGLPAGVIGHGNTPHQTLMDFLRDEATVLIHPSHLETFGMIILEAKARGVPVIGGIRSGGVPYVCGENQGGLLVDVNDPKVIADAALKTIDDQAAYLQMAADAHDDAKQRFDNTIVTKRLVSVYEAILSGNWSLQGEGRG